MEDSVNRMNSKEGGELTLTSDAVQARMASKRLWRTGTFLMSGGSKPKDTCGCQLQAVEGVVPVYVRGRGFPQWSTLVNAPDEGKLCGLNGPHGMIEDIVGACICGMDPKPLNGSCDGSEIRRCRV